MHYARFMLLPLVFVAVACQPTTPALTEAQRDAIADTILELENAVVRAVDGVDLEGFISHYADSPDLVIVGGGRMVDLETLREQLQQGWSTVRNHSHQIEQRSIFVLGPDAVVSSFVGELRSVYDDGDAEDVMLEVTAIWTRWNGEWKVLYEHVCSRPKSM